MLRSLAATGVFALAACSGGGERDNATAFDVNAAAARAEGDIANYAAGTRPAPAPPAAPSLTPAVVPVANAVAEIRLEAGSAQAAADVVQRYYALIGEAKYPEAWALWREGGTASGMTEAAFAVSFDAYAEYHAEVGPPGDIDAGAGQRYVAVPVRLYGTLKNGDPFVMAGSVTLHRVGDGIDTADPTDHAWRIDRADIKPRPADAVSRPHPPRSPAPQDPPG